MGLEYEIVVTAPPQLDSALQYVLGKDARCQEKLESRSANPARM
jgi:hypothetical protein